MLGRARRIFAIHLHRLDGVGHVFAAIDQKSNPAGKKCFSI